MYIIRLRKIYAHLDITHQAHFTVSWKIWILCHMSAYQENIMKFWFFEGIQFCYTLISVAAIYLEGDINSSSFAFKFWNFQHSELWSKSRANFKIAKKDYTVIYSIIWHWEMETFTKLSFVFLITNCWWLMIRSSTLTLLQRIWISWYFVDMRTYGTKSIFSSWP